MAAVTLANCTVKYNYAGEYTDVLIISPATMDSADTIDVAALLNGRTIRAASAWDSTTGDSVTCTLSTSTLTIDAAGGTTDHVYNISLRLQ